MVEDNKFQISYSAPKLLALDENGKVGYIEFCMTVLKKNDKIVGIITGDVEVTHPETNKTERAVHRHLLDPIGTTVKLNECTFMSTKDVERLRGKESDESDHRMLAEMTHDTHPPAFLKFNTLPNAVSGDHNIVLTLFYSIGSDFKMDQKVITIHVKNWIEKHQRLLQLIAVVLGLSALGAGIVQAIYTVLQYLK